MFSLQPWYPLPGTPFNERKSQNTFSYRVLTGDAAGWKRLVFTGHVGMISSQGTNKVVWKPVRGDVSAPNLRDFSWPASGVFC